MADQWSEIERRIKPGQWSLLREREIRALLAAAREGERLKALLAERVKRCTCRGTGVVDVPCDFCDDSTYDHECNDRKAPCSDSGCISARSALAGKGGGNG